MTEHRATEADRGNAIAKALWETLQKAKTIVFVPWVTTPGSPAFDARKAGFDSGRAELIEELEAVIDRMSEEFAADVEANAEHDARADEARLAAIEEERLAEAASLQATQDGFAAGFEPIDPEWTEEKVAGFNALSGSELEAIADRRREFGTAKRPTLAARGGKLVPSLAAVEFQKTVEFTLRDCPKLSIEELGEIVKLAGQLSLSDRSAFSILNREL